jgi:hypothetical protein
MSMIRRLRNRRTAIPEESTEVTAEESKDSEVGTEQTNPEVTAE